MIAKADIKLGAARQALDQFVVRRVTELSAAGRCRKANLNELGRVCQLIWDAHYEDLSKVIDAVDYIFGASIDNRRSETRRQPRHQRRPTRLRVVRAK